MRVIVNVLIAAAIAYGAMLLLVFFFQPRLVYFPLVEHEYSITPRSSGLDYENVNFRSKDGVPLHGWWVPARDARGTVLLTHGNAGNISNRLGYLTMFNRLGYSVLVFDYRGYGKSGGRPDEEGTYRDADAAYRHLTDVRKLKPADIVLLGESLGGGVATWLALEHPPRALILASTFKSIPDLGAEIYPWLPVRFLARVKYDNLSRIGKIEAPVLIAHSKTDDVVPFAHGQALFDAARQPKQLLLLAGGHNEGFLFMRDDWIAAVGAFLVQTEKQIP